MDNNSSTNPTPEQGSENKESRISKLPAVPILISILILLLIVGSLYFLGKSKNNNVIKIESEAQQAANSGDYDKAKSIINEGLKSNPNSSDLISDLINLNSTVGNQSGTEKEQLQNSQSYIDQLLKQSPNGLNTLLAIGYAYETAGNYEKALTYYQQATKLFPTSSDAWFHLGHVNEFLGNRNLAYTYYNKAYSLDPNNPSVLVSRGNQLLSQGKTQDAFVSFKSASQQPNISNSLKAEALTGASLVRATQNNFQYLDEATKLSKEAVDTDPNYSPALAAYANNLLWQQDFDNSIAYFNKAIQANPRISKNYSNLSLIYRYLKKYPEAIVYMQKALASVDDDNTILSEQDRQSAKGTYTYELAKTYSLAQTPNVDTLALIQKAIELNPSITQRVQKEYVGGPLFAELNHNTEFGKILTSK